MNNVLPYKEKQLIHKAIRLRFVTVSLCVLLILCGITLILIMPSRVLLNAENKALSIEISAISGRSSSQTDQSIAALDASLTDLEGKLRITPNTTGFAAVRSILGNTPAGILVQSISISLHPATVTVSGVAQDRESLEKMETFLRGLDGVKSLQSPLSNFIKSKQGPFSVTLIF